MVQVTLGVLVLAVGLLAYLNTTHRKEITTLKQRLQPITDAEREATAILEEANQQQRMKQEEIYKLDADINRLKTQYGAGRDKLTHLEAEVGRLEENLTNIENGLYKPHFTFEDTESYKKEIEAIRQKQIAIAKRGHATVCSTKWEVGGSSKAGERMVRQTEKLLLRAFNAESDAAISNVSWNNFETMRARIEKAREVLNKHGTVLQVSLTKEYCDARIRELELVFEAAEKKKQERELQREQRAAQKEEERVQRELAKEQEEAEKDERKFEKALEKAKGEIAQVKDEERAALEARISSLESELSEAHARKERAIAQAQLTRVGHVYVISNIGAFGEGVVKIGMTRRLEPEERIKELGDASVPFPFDLHALIYSEDAPSLESQLHERLWDKRVNLSNNRKEFFKASLNDIQEVVQSLGISKELSLVPEAREYRETIALLQRVSDEITKQNSALQFPENPFEDD